MTSLPGFFGRANEPGFFQHRLDLLLELELLLLREKQSRPKRGLRVKFHFFRLKSHLGENGLGGEVEHAFLFFIPATTVTVERADFRLAARQPV